MSRNIWRIRAWLLLTPVLAIGALACFCLLINEVVESLRK